MKHQKFLPENFLILIVDDLPQNIHLLVNILENQNYKTTFAKSGKEALERVKTANPDLILLDLMMPEMDGLEVCHLLKSDDKYSHIPIIFLTASSDDEHILKAFETGAFDYITKPFKTPELLLRVKIHLELKHTQDQLKKAYLKMKKMATTDYLTGIYNRRSILWYGEQKFKCHKQDGCDLALILLDIDYFKKINDHYGHDVGDDVLIKVVHLWQNLIRPVDKLGRFGGEEFLIIVPEISRQNSLLLADFLRKSVEQLLFKVENHTFNVTISLGVGFCKSSDENLAQVIKRADQALYIAKNNGRNQVFLVP